MVIELGRPASFNWGIVFKPSFYINKLFKLCGLVNCPTGWFLLLLIGYLCQSSRYFTTQITEMCPLYDPSDPPIPICSKKNVWIYPYMHICTSYFSFPLQVSASGEQLNVFFLANLLFASRSFCLPHIFKVFGLFNLKNITAWDVCTFSPNIPKSIDILTIWVLLRCFHSICNFHRFYNIHILHIFAIIFTKFT